MYNFGLIDFTCKDFPVQLRIIWPTYTGYIFPLSTKEEHINYIDTTHARPIAQRKICLL